MSKVVSRKTQIYLDEEQYQYLQREAKKVGSIAKVIRNLIDERLRRVDVKDDPIFKLGARPFKSKEGDLSVNHDKYLYEEKH